MFARSVTREAGGRRKGELNRVRDRRGEKGEEAERDGDARGNSGDGIGVAMCWWSPVHKRTAGLFQVTELFRRRGQVGH